MKKRCGFSIAELMIAISIFGILLVIVVPQFTKNTERRKLDGDSKAVENFFREIRAEAQRKGFDVNFSVKSSSDGAGMTTITATAGTSVVRSVTLSGGVSVQDSNLNSYTMKANGVLVPADTGPVHGPRPLSDGITLTLINKSMDNGRTSYKIALKKGGAIQVTQSEGSGCSSSSSSSGGAP